MYGSRASIQSKNRSKNLGELVKLVPALVSIVMPVYNTEPFLAETIQSILDQTYEDWELILVDDFSTDRSLSIARDYAARDQRIRIFSSLQKGIIPALVQGQKHAKGEFITRMDSDDLMPKEKLSTMVAALQDKSLNNIAVGKVKYFSDGKPLEGGYTKYQDWLNNLVDTSSHFAHIYKECVIPSPCWMMRKVGFEEVGGFDVGMYPEDYDLAFRMYRSECCVVPIDKILHHWRDHQDRTSRNDINYTDQSFLPLKVYHFLSHEYMADKELFVWGAGKAGKALIKELITREVRVRWVTDSQKKVGHNIYGIKVEPTEILLEQKESFVITAIRQVDFQRENASILDRLLFKNNRIIHFH